MLRGQRHIRTQVQKLSDAMLFGVSLWLAHWIRSDNPSLAVFGGTHEIGKFGEYAWLLLLIVPFSPLVLEIHGFYSRPLLASRRRTAWQLLRGCAVSVVLVILAVFLSKQELSRGVIIL